MPKIRELARNAWPLTLLVVTVAIVTMPVLRFGFVLHDDPREIVGNPSMFPFDGAALGRFWSPVNSSQIYAPVSSTLLGGLTILARTLHSLGPLHPPTPDVFHATGVILHLINTLFVFYSSRRVICGGTNTNQSWMSVIPALLFALHPAQVETYSRAGNIPLTLAACFSLGSLLLFLRSFESGSRSIWRSVLAFFFFVFGLLSHPSAMALPLATFIFAWAAQTATVKTLVFRLMPWIIVSIAYAALTVVRAFPLFDPTLQWWERAVVAADCLTWYLAQALWPSVLTMDHARSAESVMASSTIWLSAAGLAACGVALVVLANKWRWEAAGGAIFLALLLPVSGLIPDAEREARSLVYDPALYLPLLGLAILSASLLKKLRMELRLLLSVPLICLLGIWSRGYQLVWSDSILLFDHALRVKPASWYASGQLGAALLAAGKPNDSISFLARSIRLNPNLIATRINLGHALLDSGRNEEAERILRETIKLAPGQANAHNNLSVALLRRNAWTEAEAEALTVLKLSPGHPMAMANLAMSFAGQGRKEEALDQARRTVSTHPAFPFGWRALSEILYETGQKSESITALSRACQLDPRRRDWHELLSARRRDRANIDAGAPPTPPDKKQ